MDRVPSARFRAGVDIGGTFTDIVLLAEDGTLHTRKISSRVDDHSGAIADGLAGLFRKTGLGGSDIGEIRHGTTVASNAILERKGAQTGLIATKGFRDILEIRSLRMPRLYDLHWEKPPPLVERRRRLTVDERVDRHGHAQQSLDFAEVERAIRLLLDDRVEAIAICLLNSLCQPDSRASIKQVAERLAPGLTVCASCDVLPEIKEYERPATTVINAFLKPVVEGYLASLRHNLDRAQVEAPVLLMQSNGGLTSDQVAAELPIHIVESGPAGGVIGTQALARSMGLDDIITFDMGGTAVPDPEFASRKVSVLWRPVLIVTLLRLIEATVLLATSDASVNIIPRLSHGSTGLPRALLASTRS